jgi:hypothetical protein
MVFGASRLQNCVTKLPAESKLVALMGHISFVKAFAEFCGFIVSKEAKTQTINQDSTSVILRETKGGGVVRTKHLHRQKNLCREAKRCLGWSTSTLPKCWQMG